ncbi:MAG: hypothetical protein ABJN52_00645 [Litorimonas sp.]
MMALLLRLAGRVLASRLGLALSLSAALCAALWGWHLQDKRAAVIAAREGYVQEVELIAARTRLDLLRRQIAAADQANHDLQQQMQDAESRALRFARELEAFERDTTLNPNGTVDPALLRRLRSN